MRITLVHNDDDLQASMLDALHDRDGSWEVVSARHLNEAMAQLERVASDVIVVDATVPGLDGLHLLRLVRSRYPCVLRLVFVDRADRDGVLRALEVAQQTLEKPFDAERMLELIERTRAMGRRLRSNVLQRVVGQVDRLPSAPRMYMRLRGVLGDPECHGRVVTELLDEDPALTAKVLQLANSAYFSNGGSINSVAQAVLRIGLDAVRVVVLANEVFDAHRGPAMAELRRRAVRASQMAARMAGVTCRDTARTAALLAYAGYLIPGVEALCAVEAVHADESPTPDDVGAYLLAMWGLPQLLVEAVAHHRQPSQVAHCRFDVLGIVHLATALVDAQEPDAAYLQAVGAQGRWPEWQRLAQALPESAEV